jgi:hypothetical protein
MLWRNAGKKPTSPVDPRVGVIRVDAAGKPIAILVNYSCHPVVLGPDNLQYSADYPGAMSKVVEERFGNSVCFFLQGGCGDINPYFDKMELQEDAVKLMHDAGKQLGDEVVRVCETIETKAPQPAALKHRLDVMSFKPRWDMEKVLAQLKDRMAPAVADRYRRFLSLPLDCPVMTVLIGDDIALMGMPGEPFVEFAIDFRTRSPAANSFFVGYANGHLGYFPTIVAAVQGGYGANNISTRAEVGAGESMVDRAIVTLQKMLGRLKPTPAPG